MPAAPTTESDANASQDKPPTGRRSWKFKITLLILILVLTISACGAAFFLIYRNKSPSSYSSSEFFPHSAEDEQRLRRIVDEINGRNLPWKAEYNPLASIRDKQRDENVDYWTIKEFGDIAAEVGRAKAILADTIEHLVELANQSIALPASFDAREHWPSCSSMRHIQNQGGCGSCWAAATTALLSDRLCIASNGTDQALLSTQDLLSCCDNCGGCLGTRHLGQGLQYWKEHGLVSGGSLGCQPYEISSTCGAPCSPYYFQEQFTPTCKRKCQPQFAGDYNADRKGKAKSAYFLRMDQSDAAVFQILAGLEFQEWKDTGKSTLRNAGHMTSEQWIKREVFLHGPVAIATQINELFAHYKSGVYTTVNGVGPLNYTMSYGHVMKLLGWGEERGQKYWIIANSWGTKWGEGGFARVSMDAFYSLSVAAGQWE